MEPGSSRTGIHVWLSPVSDLLQAAEEARTRAGYSDTDQRYGGRSTVMTCGSDAAFTRLFRTHLARRMTRTTTSTTRCTSTATPSSSRDRARTHRPGQEPAFGPGVRGQAIRRPGQRPGILDRMHGRAGPLGDSWRADEHDVRHARRSCSRLLIRRRDRRRTNPHSLTAGTGPSTEPGRGGLVSGCGAAPVKPVLRNGRHLRLRGSRQTRLLRSGRHWPQIGPFDDNFGGWVVEVGNRGQNGDNFGASTGQFVPRAQSVRASPWQKMSRRSSTAPAPAVACVPLDGAKNG